MKIYISSRVLHPKHSGGIVAYFLGVAGALATQPDSPHEIHLGLNVHGGEFASALPHAVRIHIHWLRGLDCEIQAESERAVIDELDPDWVIYFVADPQNYHGQGTFKVATCVADLQHLHLPDFFKPAHRDMRDEAFSRSIGFSDLVFTLSRFCQRDIARTFHLSESEVRIVSPALRGLFLAGPATTAEIAQTRQKFELPPHFALFPGNFWRHKNHPRLLRAFAQWYRDWKSKPSDISGPEPHLVLVGSAVEGGADWHQLLHEGARAGWLSTLGFVSEPELRALFSTARCLVFPSLFEGFGLPVLEALALGRPVASANSTSLPEVGGDLPHYFDPTDEADMRQAIEAAWSEPITDSFIERARAQSAQFRYDESGRVLRTALEEISTSRAPREPAEYWLVDEPPLVSIVTPSFQHAAFLKQCIESVLSQDYPNIEYAVFDGGSTDGSVDILRGYGDRFHWESGPDGGQTHAINKGLRRARGQILGYLNSDDFLLPGAISKVVKAWRRKPSADVVYGKAHWADESGVITSPYATRSFESERFRNECFICQPACFWRRQTMDKFGQFDERYQLAMDYEYWQRILAGGGVISFLDEFLACSRAHAATKTQTQRVRVFKDIFASQWQLWGGVHRGWWLELLRYLADERKGVWRHVISSKGSGRRRMADRLSRWVRKPPFRNGRIRRPHEGFYPDGWVVARSWIDICLCESTELSLEGISPTSNEIRVLINRKEICSTPARASEPFRPRLGFAAWRPPYPCPRGRGATHGKRPRGRLPDRRDESLYALRDSARAAGPREAERMMREFLAPNCVVRACFICV